MGSILTFGEIMLRLMPDDGHRLFQNDRLEATFGGGEANVSVSLANFGCDAGFMTVLPNNPVGQAAINSLRYFGVDTEKIIRQGERIGVYFVEKGQSQRPSKVIYDRKYSAIAQAPHTVYDWESIFEGVEWFHFTGITPALSDELKIVCKEACIAAKRLGVKVSCDLNYRSTLWTAEEAFRTMDELMYYVDVCIANEEDAEKVLRISAANTDVDQGDLDIDAYHQVAQTIHEIYGCESVAITLRSSKTANDNTWAGLLFRDQTIFLSKSYDIHLWDRVGGGDSFSAGLIYGLIRGLDNQHTVEFAAAASCLKQTIQGDFNRVSVAEVENLVRGSGSGRVVR